MSINRKIAKASFVLIAASALVNVLGLAKEMLVASRYGITQAMDAFYAASAIPNLLNNVILSTFVAVFIPVFVRYRLDNRGKAEGLASATVNYIFLFLSVLSGIVYVFAPDIIGLAFRGLSGETAAMAVSQLRILCFTVVFSGLSGALIGILNTYECFFFPAFSQALVSLTTIAFVLVFFKTQGIAALAYGSLFGLLLQFLFLVPLARSRGLRHGFGFSADQPAMKELLISMATFLVAIAAAQMNVVVDKVMASYLAPGSISALTYADKLVQVPLIIFSSSIAAAVFPFFSSQAAQNRLEEMKDSLAKSIRMSAFIFLPVNVLMILFARPLIQALFQRGAFDEQATQLTSLLLVCYSFQYLFYTAGLIMSRVFLALQDIATQAKIAVAGMAVNLLLNVVFMRLIDPPVAGIALSTSATYLVVMLLDFIFLKRKITQLHGLFILRGTATIAVSAAVMGVS
ncbi:MAG: murein biosynthesis integral membrane protein MurJ, partial [Endomicrobiales bacterium]